MIQYTRAPGCQAIVQASYQPTGAGRINGLRQEEGTQEFDAYARAREEHHEDRKIRIKAVDYVVNGVNFQIIVYCTENEITAIWPPELFWIDVDGAFHVEKCGSIVDALRRADMLAGSHPAAA